MELVFVLAATSDLDYYIDLFIKVKSATRKPATVTWYRRVLGYYRAAIDDLQPTWPPTLSHVLAFFETFETKGLKDYSRNNYYRALAAWLGWLKRAGYIGQNPLDFLDPIKAPRPLPRAPAEETVSNLLATIEITADSWHDIRDIALFSIALGTGARPGELARMLVSDVDPAGQQIKVHSRKDYEDRNLILDDDTFINLSHWLKVRATLDLPPDLRHLWVSDRKSRGYAALTYWGIYERLQFWRKRAAVEHFSLYALRHAFAIYSLRENLDLLDIKDQMGHASITTTAIYTQVVNQGRLERHRKANPLKHLKKSG